MISPLLNQTQLAEILGVTEWTIWSLRRRNLLPPAIRVGKSLRWRACIVEKWILDNERPANEFDAELCERAEKAVASRSQKSKPQPKPEKTKKPARRGRPTKAEQIAKRGMNE